MHKETKDLSSNTFSTDNIVLCYKILIHTSVAMSDYKTVVTGSEKGDVIRQAWKTGRFCQFAQEFQFI